MTIEPENTLPHVPGLEGTIGPGPAQYGQPHVYARSVHSGSGNCVCGHDLGHRLHVQAAPGVPVPERFRTDRDDPSQPAPKIYVPDPSLPTAWVVDLDGTLALHREGDDARSPFDWHRVREDLPNRPVIAIVNALPDVIIIVSGRSAICREETMDWLRDHNVRCTELHMRSVGDFRKDSVVKSELFDQHVAPHFNVVGALDDRDQVVAMWRSRGLMCAQVAPGNF